MEGAYQCRTCGKGVLFPTNSTTYRCYACQKINSSQPTGEAEVTCSGCKRVSIVPTNTTTYRCYACQDVSNSISRYKQSREDGGIRSQMKNIGARLFRRDQLYNANTNGHLLSGSSASTGSSSSLSTRCNKRAVLCGVTYRQRKFKLKGTVDDVSNMRDLLVTIFKFPIECIRVLTEREHNPNLIPTKRNILESLKWLVEDSQSGDSLVFYFSGHGLQQKDFQEDETDGFNETLCPVDFMTEGMIVDNEINSTIVWPLKKGVTLHAIIDACHSGTALDLIYVYKRQDGIWLWEDNKPPAKEPQRKHTSGGLAICLSACDDSQLAANATGFVRKGLNGVMTHFFTKTVRDNPEITYGRLLETMHNEIEQFQRGKCYSSIFKRIFPSKIEQLNDLWNISRKNGSRREIPAFGVDDDPEEKNLLRIPTKYNMRTAMRWLVDGCQPGDSLVFHYSGHGSKEVDINMDEIDGFDEALCPVDYEHEGKILDDEINATIVRPLPRGAKLHALIDTCFSGTVLDLPFMCRMNRNGYYGWEDHRHPRAVYRGTRGGLAICISASDDDGNAADTPAFSGMENRGALTFSFIQAMQDEPRMTYGRLLNAMRSTIRGAKARTFDQDGQQLAMDIRHEPQLSSSEKFDIYSKSIVM